MCRNLPFRSVKSSSQSVSPLIMFEKTSDIQLQERFTISTIDTTHDDKICMCDYYSHKIVAYTKDNTHQKDLNHGKPFGTAVREIKNDVFTFLRCPLI